MKTLAFLGASALAAGSIALASTFAPAQAATFTFSCDPALSPADCAGDEGGTLNITSLADGGSFLYTVAVNNTSLAAGITGIGFDFNPDFEFDMFVDGSLSVILADGTDISSLWAVAPNNSPGSPNGSSLTGVNLNFIDFDTAINPGNINNRAIFNIDEMLDATISFRLTDNLVAEGGFMRLQRTGADGKGSLKLVDIPTAVPEPATAMALGTFALLGLAMKKKSQASA